MIPSAGRFPTGNPSFEKFAEQHDLILFVSREEEFQWKSAVRGLSRGQPRTYFISDVEEIDYAWFDGVQSIGICGATSTPMWLMQKVASHLEPIGTSA